jgi:hypothetical protein
MSSHAISPYVTVNHFPPEKKKREVFFARGLIPFWGDD